MARKKTKKKQRTRTVEVILKQSKGKFSIFKKKGPSKKGFDYSAMLTLRQLLSNEKARILYTIKTKHPRSIYDLAKKLDRGFKAVSDDVKLLERFGFIQLVQRKTKNRIRHVPKIVVDKITIHLNV